jgi:hypothetical protein
VQALIMAVLRRRGYGRVIADAFRGARPDTRGLFVGVAAAAGREAEFTNEALLTQLFTPDALARESARG